MYITFKTSARLCALFFMFLFCSTAFAGSTKVEICHVPPDNPENFHTIRINAKALPSHLAHGDLGEACDAVCAALCDDGNACTKDDGIEDCEQNGCPVIPEPVDCNDQNACTTDSCEPADGCSNNPVVCTALDTCAVGMCAPDTGECVDAPIVCDEGFECNPEINECEALTACPCFDATDLQALGTIDPNQCGDNFPSPDQAAVYYTNDSLACSGTDCGSSAVACGVYDTVNNFASDLPVMHDQNMACRQLIADSCPSASPGLNAAADEGAVEYSLPLLSNQ